MHVMIMPDTIMIRLGPCRGKGTSTSRYGQKRNNVAVSMSSRPISCQYNARFHQDEGRFSFKEAHCHISITKDTSPSTQVPNDKARSMWG